MGSRTSAWELQIYRRFLPHWRMDGAWYFVTFNVWRGTLSVKEIAIVRDHIAGGSGRFYNLSAACVMPDHVHLILTPLPGISLSRITKGIKGVSARLINAKRGSTGRIWQVESWDRILRDQEEFEEKLRYMLNNPLEEGLVDDPWTWCGWYLNPSHESTGKNACATEP
jgi:REP element-mobilizing transposase RayT